MSTRPISAGCSERDVNKIREIKIRICRTKRNKTHLDRHGLRTVNVFVKSGPEVKFLCGQQPELADAEVPIVAGSLWTKLVSRRCYAEFRVPAEYCSLRAREQIGKGIKATRFFPSSKFLVEEGGSQFWDWRNISADNKEFIVIQIQTNLFLLWRINVST